MNDSRRLLDQLLVTEQEAARLLGVCGKTIYELRKRGELEFVPVGRGIRYEVQSLRDWIARKKERVA